MMQKVSSYTSPNKSLELTGVRLPGSRCKADNSDQADLIRACSSTLCYARKAVFFCRVVLNGSPMPACAGRAKRADLTNIRQ
jgi:hypothetical protein